MKILVRIFIIFLFLILPAYAVTYDVLVIPADIFQTKENYYSFDEASEIFANDIIKNFNNSNGKIKASDLYFVRSRLVQNPQAKQNLQNALAKYKTSGVIDYDTLKSIGNDFNCKLILLVSSYAVTNKNSIKRGVWEVLEVSTTFDAVYPYRLETSALLLDVSNGIVMWSNTYSSKLGANDNIFAAKNYAQANAEYEKIKLYSRTIVSPSVSQNIILRFFPKSITPVQTEVKDTGGALRYDKTIPEKPKKQQDNIPYTGDMFFDF